MARTSLTPTTRTPCDESQVFLYKENFLRTCFVSPEESQRSASPLARASLMPATHTPGDDSQVSGDSETFVPAYFVSPEQNQSSILFRATPLRQQRLNDSERKEKRSECAFPCAFSRECGMQLSCDVRFRVFLACAAHFAPRRSKPHTDKQLQTKRARTEVCAGPGTWGIPAVLCSCVCGMQLSCGVRFRTFGACATHCGVRRSKPQTDKQRQTTHAVVRRSKPQTDKQRQTKRASAEVCTGAGTRGIPAPSSKLEEADCPGFFSEILHPGWVACLCCLFLRLGRPRVDLCWPEWIHLVGYVEQMLGPY